MNAVIADRKIAFDLGEDSPPDQNDIDYFEADVISYSDYYPYGMEMKALNR